MADLTWKQRAVMGDFFGEGVALVTSGGFWQSHFRLRIIVFLKSIYVEVLHARTPRFGYRIYFRSQVKGGKDRVINLLRQGRRELHNEGMANVTSTITGSKRLIMRGTLSFHWSKGKLYWVTAIFEVPLYVVFQNEAVVVLSEFECLWLFHVNSWSVVSSGINTQGSRSEDRNQGFRGN
jgi:hypothetical protein